jgi:ABC-type glutathione transport system ATPase component
VAARADFNLQMETSASERSTGENGAIVRLIDVHKTYRTGEMEVHAVRGVSIEIRRSEFVALMGPAVPENRRS